MGSIAQLVRASSRQGEGPQFESEYSHQVRGFREAKTRTSAAGNCEANAESADHKVDGFRDGPTVRAKTSTAEHPAGICVAKAERVIGSRSAS